MAEGYEPQFITLVDPFEDPIEFQLVPRPVETPEPERVAHGRLLDAAGEPVVGATLGPYGIRNGDRRQFGGLEDIDPVIITDEEGRFAIVSPVAVDAFFVKVDARGLAPAALQLPTGEDDLPVELGEGVAVSGRLLKDGEPVAGVAMGLVQGDHAAETFLGEFTIGTDEDGRFLFPNVTPDENYVLYGKLSTLGGIGAVPIRDVATAGHGTTLDVGEVLVLRGFALSGRVFLSDDEPVPPDTRLVIGRETTWDTLVVPLAADGSFAVTGLPAEQLRLSVRVRGYRLSAENYSLDIVNPFGLLGRLEGDTAGLEILMEPGAPDYSRPSDEAVREHMKRREEPLAGIEARDE